ncbi:hypothetical protein K7432_000097 [Basidiobolus ranarum]|uniref:Uncharacterized protein n=1 Tax=Basidiobolus ranarum TaxID=34480 RepID=A0ABR2X5I3_9FUNG
MQLINLFLVFTVFTLTVQSLPADPKLEVVAGDKRDLHDFCGGWFCGHTKREEISEIPNINSKMEKIVNTQPPTAGDKRDLHDLCGRWFCGHTKKRSVSLRDRLRSSISKSVASFNN